MADPRSQFYGVVLDPTGNIVTTATATVYVAPPFAAQPMQSFATVYNTETGSGSPGNPIALTTGQIDFWAPTGAYDILIQDQSSPKKFDDRVVRFDSIPANGGVGAAQIAADSINASKVQDGTLTLADLADIVSQSLSLTGEGKIWYTNTAPTGYLFCNGQAVSRTTYSALFNLIGTTYGAGNGTTTFNLPDLCGRVPVGAGASQNPTGATLTNRSIGSRFGLEKVALVIAELAAHSHGITDNGHAHSVYDPGHEHFSTDSQVNVFVNNNNPYDANNTMRVVPAGQAPAGAIGAQAVGNTTTHAATGIGINGAATGVSVQNNGGGTAHENQQPSTSVNFIIKYT
jgi:microcystin-dependent protein